MRPNSPSAHCALLLDKCRIFHYIEMAESREQAILQQQTTIAGGAELTLRAFQQCLYLSASLHPRELALVEDQLARFSIWTASIGVFARGRASMDHRLREATDVHEAVTSLLEDLTDGIQNCRYISTSTS